MAETEGQVTPLGPEQKERVRLAVLLAAHDPFARLDSQEIAHRGGIDRDRFGWGTPRLCWRLTVGASGPWHISPAEAAALLKVATTAGQSLVVRSGLMDLCLTLAALAAPGGACARAASLLKIDRVMIVRALRAAGLDLDHRTLGGVAWMRLSTQHTSKSYEVVADDANQGSGQLRLSEAIALDPDLRIGQRFSFSVGCSELDELLATFADFLPVGWLEAESLQTHREGGIRQALRLDERTAREVGLLLGSIDSPLCQRLFEDAHAESVVFRCPHDAIGQTIASFRSRWYVGARWWPVVIGGDDDLMNTRDARRNPCRASSVLFKAVNDAANGLHGRARGPDLPSGHALGTHSAPTWIALVPVEQPYEVPAHFQCWHNGMPEAKALVELLRHLQQTTGALVLEHRFDSLVVEVARPGSIPRQLLLEIAEELHGICPDVVPNSSNWRNETVEALAANQRWNLWWD